MLDVKNVSKTFAKGTVNEHIALEKINLHLDRGEFLTIVGSNGAGKSTLFNLICGTFMQDSGRIIIDLDKEQKSHMTVSDLLALYREKETKEFDTDRILLQKEEPTQ